ncbi:MAG: hypothetical protein M3N23_05590 [Pseudomonadota bacterium]|nr:hypothetical protein [Pseudomonadota bacterium]
MNISPTSHQIVFISKQIGAACLMLFAAITPAQADAPLVGMWVAVNVTQCKAITFEAPANQPGWYVPGEKYRTAQVTGLVVDAGLQPFNASEEWRRKVADEAKGRIPVKGAEMFLVLRAWSAPFCEAAIGHVERFNYDYSCDTLLREGPCLPPHQLVTSASR